MQEAKWPEMTDHADHLVMRLASPKAVHPGSGWVSLFPFPDTAMSPLNGHRRLPARATGKQQTQRDVLPGGQAGGTGAGGAMTISCNT